MKKSILFLIGVIYILSIVAVSFYGLKIQNYHENKYPDHIALLNQSDEENGVKIVKNEIVNEAGEKYDSYDIYIQLSMIDTIKLDFELSRVDGKEVNVTDLKFSLASATGNGGLSNDVCSINTDGTVTFKSIPGEPITATQLDVSCPAKSTVKLEIHFIVFDE